MSNYPIFGCGLPSKPRAAEPSMFEILSWPYENQLSESKFEEREEKTYQEECEHHKHLNNEPEVQQVADKCENHNKVECMKSQSPKKIVEEAYKEHKSPLKEQNLMKETIKNVKDDSLENKSKNFIMSKIHQKEIKHELYSYEPVHLKSSRSKSAVVVKKDEKITENLPQKEEPELDEKTIQERKQKLKEFELFTRVLPNSAFTTYYGKPAFEAYGRGASEHNLMSYNIMPHKGDNRPKNIESHYTALMKGRTIKAKSYLPRKPIEENFVPSGDQHENNDLKNLNFAIEKPDLIKSNRFATIRPETSKKAGPPIMQQSTVHGIKRNHTETKKPKKNEKVPKKIKQKKTSDGLKYMNERENLIELLEEKKMKASQLAYKVTECYPSELEVPELKESYISKENWSQFKPAGKATLKSDQVSDLLQSKLVLQEKNNV